MVEYKTKPSIADTKRAIAIWFIRNKEHSTKTSWSKQCKLDDDARHVREFEQREDELNNYIVDNGYHLTRAWETGKGQRLVRQVCSLKLQVGKGWNKEFSERRLKKLEKKLEKIYG